MSDGTTLSLDSGITARNVINLDPAATGNINVSEGTGMLTGVITGINSILAKTGDGTLILSGTNTYTGDTWINRGKLYISNASNIGKGTIHIMD